MGIGLVLLATGLFLLAPGRDIVTEPAQRLDIVAVLLTAGASLLLISRRPSAFWLVLTTVGSIGYVAERTNPWAPPGWHDRVLLISIVLFGAASLLAVVPPPGQTGAVPLLTLVLGGILWLGLERPGDLPWNAATQALLVDAFVAVATVQLVLWLRAARRSRAGFVLTAGAVAMFTLEQTRAWAPAGWHDRITLVTTIAAIIGILASLADYLERDAYLMAFVAGVGWGVGALVVRQAPPWRIRLGPGLTGTLDIVAAGLLVVAVTAFVCFAIQVVTEALGQYRDEDGEDHPFAKDCIALTVVSGIGFLLAVVALTALRVFDQSGSGVFLLLLLLLVGLAGGFAGVWTLIAGLADRREPARLPLGVDELPAFLTRSVTVGPRALGSGPAIAYAGIVLLLTCALIIRTAAAWFTLGLIGGALIVAGIALSSSRFLHGLGNRAEVDGDSVRLSARHIRQQEDLMPRAAALLGSGVVLSFLVAADSVPGVVRFVLSVLVVVAVFAATSAPAHLVIALLSKREEIGWSEVRNDRRLRQPIRLARAGFVVGVTTLIWVTLFDPPDWLRVILTLAAVLGLVAAIALGGFTVVRVTETIRTGDHTLADRARRIAATPGNLYRLLPAPRSAWDREPAEDPFDSDLFADLDWRDP